MGLFLLVDVAFSNVIHNDFIHLDDDIYIFDNPHVQQGLTAESICWAFSADLLFDSVHADYWRPISVLSHLLDVTLFDLRPAGHHFTSLFIHQLNAVLLFWLLSRLTGRAGLAVAAAALFAVHPLRVESVAWIAERKDVLCVFFSLAAIHAYLSYVRRAGGGVYLWMAVLFGLALMSKPMAVTLPLLLILLDIWPIGRRQILEKVPLFVLSAVSGWITLKSAGGAAFESADIAEAFSRAAVSYVVYLQKTLWPSGLAVFYPAQPVSVAAAAAAVLFLIGITVFTLQQLKGRPFLFTGWGWYVISLGPVVGLSTIANADRFTYLPHIGLMIAVVWGAADLMERRPTIRRAAGIATMMVVTGLVFLTRSYVEVWHDHLSLFRHALRVTSDNWFAHHHLATELVTRDRPEEAVVHYRAAIRLKPEHMLARMNLALILARRGETAEAVAQYEKVLELSPDFSEAHNKLGEVLLQQGNLEGAILHFQRALHLQPNDPRLKKNLNDARALQNRF